MDNDPATKTVASSPPADRPGRMVGRWRQARATCGPGCFGKHATWPLLRGLGIVPSPRWHIGWYSRLIANAAGLGEGDAPATERRPDQPLRIVVVRPEDHRLPAMLDALAEPVPVEVHVLSDCETPLGAVQRWATRHDKAATVHHGTLPKKAGPFDLAIVADDMIDTRIENRDHIDALAPVVDALAPGSRLGYATRVGPSVMMAHTHEYADFVRHVQSLAGLCWRHRTPSRRQVAVARWQQPPSYYPEYEWVGIRDVMAGAGLVNVAHDIDIYEKPTRLLRWHPDEITLGAGSHMLRMTGAAPLEDDPHLPVGVTPPGASVAACSRATPPPRSGFGPAWTVDRRMSSTDAVSTRAPGRIRSARL